MYSDYQKFLLTGEFNAKVSAHYLETFLYHHEFKSLSKDYIDLLFSNYAFARETATRGGGRGAVLPPPNPISISEPNKVQQFQFQISNVLLLTTVQKLYGPEIQKFHDFYRACYNFSGIYGGFSIFLIT